MKKKIIKILLLFALACFAFSGYYVFFRMTPEFSDKYYLGITVGNAGWGERYECIGADVIITTDKEVLIFMPNEEGERVQLATLSLTDKQYDNIVKGVNRKKLYLLDPKEDNSVCDGSSKIINLYGTDQKIVKSCGGYMPKSKAFNDMYQLVKDNLPMDEIKAIRFVQIEKLKAADEARMEEYEASKLKVKEQIFADPEEFMEFYGITEDEIPKEYIQDYIWAHRVKPEYLFDDGMDFGKNVRDDYTLKVDQYEYFDDHFHGPVSDLPLDEYMKNVTMIKIEFTFQDGELSAENAAAIDLKDGVIYYSDGIIGRLSDAKLSAELSDEDVAKIREELPTHMVENSSEGSWRDSNDYRITITMRDDKYEGIIFYSYGSNEEAVPGFHEYFKQLYKDSFGEDWVLEVR